MRAIQGAFPCMKDRIRIDEIGERRVCMHLLPLLCNFRAENVGLNQLKSTCCPGCDVDARFFIHLWMMRKADGCLKN